MPWIPPEKVDEILQKADIVEVISEYLPLKKKGSNYWALSPFKQERNPSFAVSPTKQIFKDFSSGKGGNVVTFLMEMEGFTYWEALAYLAKKYNVELPESQTDRELSRAHQRKQESLLIALQYAKEFYKAQWYHNPIAMEYFKRRGLSEETVSLFELGYAPNEPTALYSYLKSKQFSDEVLMEAGLVRQRENGQMEDFFRNRWLFPITDPRKRVIGFGGRVVDEKFGPKYVNSPETLLFKKQEVFYGFGHSRIPIREKRVAYVVEGYMDLLSLWESGIFNVVATCGTSLTEQHALLLKRFCDRVILVFDSDEAGIQAALRGIRLLLQVDLEVKVVLLDGGKDPNDLLINYGADGLRRELQEKEKSWIDFLFEQLHLNPSPTPDQLHQAIHSLASYLLHIKDPIRLDLYLTYGAEKLKVDKQLLIHVLEKQRRAEERGFRIPRHSIQRNEKTTESYSTDPPTREILRILLRHYADEVEIENQKYTVWQLLEGLLKEVEFENPVYETIRQLFLQGMEQMPSNPLHFLLVHEDEQVRQVASDLLVQEEVSPNWRRWDVYEEDQKEMLVKQLQEAIHLFNFQVVSKWLRDLMMELKAAQEKGEDISQLLNKYQSLLAARKDLAQKLGIVISEPSKWS